MAHIDHDDHAAEGSPAATVARCGLKDALVPSEAVRLVPASYDLEFPPVPFPTLRVLRLAGEPTLRALVRRHHERLLDSPVAGLFPTDREVLEKLIDKVGDFVVEACGGGPLYSSANGFTCMRTRHLPFLIEESAREVWLEALWRAMDDVAFPDDAREEYWTWLEAMSIRMINRRTIRDQPPRHPYAEMRARNAARRTAASP